MREIQWAPIVGAATRAPSIHNTQPWRFTATGGVLDVHLDRERSLPLVDPSGRQQVLSCGIAVAFAETAARAAGLAAEVELLPSPVDQDHLARLRITGDHRADDEDRTLEAAIWSRHTERGAFGPRAVPAELLDRLQREAGASGAWFKAITRPEEEVATVFLLSQAEEMERRDPAYAEELAKWLRSDPTAVDGVPVAAVPAEDPHERPSNWPVRDFLAASREQHPFRATRDADAPPPEVERPTVVLLGTAGDDHTAWVEAGLALGRILLVATAEGLVASPLTQALDWPATRTRLRQRLSLVGHPQMLLRMGYPAASSATAPSGRRAVSDVLRVRVPH